MTMARVIIGTLAAVVVLVSCSTAPPAGVYVRPGVTEEQVAADRADCAARAAASDARTTTLASAPREDVDSCMRARGYALRK